MLTDGSNITTTEYAGAQYKNGVLEFIPQPEGYIEYNQSSSPSSGGGAVGGGGAFNYVYQYADHNGNIRLSYTDKNNDGTITTDEIVEENNYYPFGLKQKGYNSAVTGRSHQYKYNNTELEEGLGLNWYEMPLRSYDPTIARWNRIDPVIHYSLSTYNSFDNNPIIYADPSGGNSGHAVSGGQYHNARLIPNDRANFGGASPHDYAAIASSGLYDNNRHVNRSEFTSFGNNVMGALASFGIYSNCNNCQEGQTRLVERSIMGSHFSYNEYYHAGGLGEEAGWYGESDYFEIFRTTIRAIGQGQYSFDKLDDFGFTEDVHLAMLGWAVQAYDYYGGEVQLARGNINAMDFDSPVFILASLKTVGALFLRSSAAEIPIMKNTIGAARAGFSRSPWTLTNEGASVIKVHKRFGKLYKSKSDGLWWAVDNAGHGGSRFKVFFESKKGLKWFKDADEFGDFILNKHKGPTGTFIPWGQLKTVK